MISLKDDADVLIGRRLLVPAFNTLALLWYPSVSKRTLISSKLAPEDGIEPLISSLEFISFINSWKDEIRLKFAG